MRKISESTVRRLSLYLRFLEQFAAQGQTTISSAELARRGGATSPHGRKSLSLFVSFGKRGAGAGDAECCGGQPLKPGTRKAERGTAMGGRARCDARRTVPRSALRLPR